MTVSTKNFHPDTDPKLLCTCGHPDCDKRSVNQQTLDRVQLVRSAANRALTVTSGGRCPHHPNEVDRTTPADHQNCVGVDVFYSGELERNEMMVLAGRHGATAVAAGSNFVHMGWRDVSDQRVRTWSY